MVSVAEGVDMAKKTRKWVFIGEFPESGCRRGEFEIQKQPRSLDILDGGDICQWFGRFCDSIDPQSPRNVAQICPDGDEKFTQKSQKNQKNKNYKMSQLKTGYSDYSPCATPWPSR